MIAIAAIAKELGAKILPHLNRIAPAVIGFLTTRAITTTTPADIRAAKSTSYSQKNSLNLCLLIFEL